MSWFKRIVLLGLLGFVAWRVHDVRGRLSREDADPAAVERLRRNFESLPLVVDGRYVATGATRATGLSWSPLQFSRRLQGNTCNVV